MADLRPQVTSTPAGGGWWQRNRWALLLLPFVVALILGLGAYRVHAFWWTSGLHEPSHAPVGGSSTLTETFVDAQGEHRRTVTMGAGPAAVVTAYPGLGGEEQSVEEVPGTRVWHVQLQVEAAPDQVLSGCRVEIVDDRGRTFRVLHGDIGWELPSDLCVPSGTPGPSYDLGEAWGLEDAETPPRPASYSAPIYVRLTGGAAPAQVRVIWAEPKYLALDLDVEHP